jgi:hypothetical protein
MKTIFTKEYVVEGINSVISGKITVDQLVDDMNNMVNFVGKMEDLSQIEDIANKVNEICAYINKKEGGVA